MAIFTIKCVLLFTIIMVTLNGIKSRELEVVGVQDIINQITQMADNLNQSMHNQTLMAQNPTTNLLDRSLGTQNRLEETLIQVFNTFNRSVDTQQRMEDTLNQMANTQTQTANTLTQMANAFTQSIDTQQRMEDTLNQMANAFTQSVDTQHRIEDSQHRLEDSQHRIEHTLDQIANTQTRMANTQTQMANTQTQMANTQTQMANTFTESMDTQHRIEDTLNQMANTFTQVVNRIEDALGQITDTQTETANTQTKTANALTQVVNLMQMQNEKLQNMTATTTYMVGQINTQNQLISQQPNDIRDCSDLASRGAFPSGSYIIQSMDDLESFRVYCDMDTDDGGWTVFQRRFDGSVDFYRGWDAYEDGFGSLDGEYWLGLRQIHRLTGQGNWTLRIDLLDYENNTAFAEFRSFSVGDAAAYYPLSVGAYSGNAGDSLTCVNNQAFSTKDSDHDIWYNNCAQRRQGAWWYGSCASSNLNGLYLGESQVSNTGITWYYWKNSNEELKRSEMKIRRIN